MSASINKVALVTGASDGIGAACALELVAQGFAVGLVARSETKIQQLAATITQIGGISFAVGADLANLDQGSNACQQIADKLGPISVLVNNAALVTPIGDITEIDAEQFSYCINTNLFGVWNMSKTVLPAMVAAGEGTIINMSSGAANRVIDGLSAYCISKAAVVMLTRSLDAEYRAKGINVYGFRPGMVATNMQKQIFASGKRSRSEVTLEDMLDPKIPAKAIAWLAVNRPEQWLGEEPDIRDKNFQTQAGLKQF